MSPDDPFWKIHNGLPRQAPGSDATTLHLLDLAGNPKGKGLDIGCGPGRASLLLASAGIELTAIDTHQPFLDELESSARSQGLTDALTIRNIAMEELEYPDDSIDLIWSEGAAYLMGLENAMRTWRPFIKLNGLLVVTECCWLTDTPSPEAREFWDESYPDMPTLAAIAEMATRSGYQVVDAYILPKSDWDEYYLPMKARVASLDSVTDEDMQTTLAKVKREISTYENHLVEYGYAGFVLKKNS